jgi:putative ABC transport system substrate-binding protein
MNRRAFLTGLGAVLVAPLSAEAQHARRVRIGWLSIAPHPFIAAFRGGLRDLGYHEQTFVIDERYAEGQPDRLLVLARELVAQRVDVLVTSGGAAGRAAMKATSSVPVVAITADLVGVGLVRSLPHPGGNITGLDIVSADLAVKWLELLRAAIPNITRVAILVDTSGISRLFAGMTAATPSLGVHLIQLGATDAAGIDTAFTEAVRQRVEGIIPVASPMFATHKREIVSLAAKYRIPAMYEHRDFVDAGGLMSYGPNLDDVFRRAAGYVDRILKGAKPGDLPIEQPTKFELVINLKAAKALGLIIAPSLLLRADQILE